MTTRVERIGDRLGILLTEQEVEALSLREGSVVDVRNADTPEGTTHMTTEEALAAFESTEPQYAEVYRALAK